jgi:GxxExxY protein
LEAERQVRLPITYAGGVLPDAYRLDLLVQRSVIVEVKSVDAISSLHRAQLLTYLRLSGLHVGPILNLNSKILAKAIVRVVLD